MQTFHLDTLLQDGQTHSAPYYEFLRSRDMSVGVYHLAAGRTDTQGVHAEDVLFYVVRGAASMRVGDDQIEVNAGSIVHVPKGVAPRFSAVHSDIDVLVVFAPAESAPTIEIRQSV
jgi:quercetin dioxygenase-like cupin family protein